MMDRIEINENRNTYDDPEISIIVPIYQSESYLEECLDSILSQSFTDFELVLIDDGSRDQSGAICDKYADIDKRIRVLHEAHGGVSVARNHGLECCRGRYLTFVDSDDVLLSHDYLQILYDLLIQNGADASVCGLQTFRCEDPIPPAGTFFKGIRLVSGREYFIERDVSFEYAPFFITKALFRREVFQNILFPEGMIHEDIAISAHVFYPCKRIVLTGTQMYGARRHPHSNETKAGSYINNYVDFIKALKINLRFLQKNNELRFTLRVMRAMEKTMGVMHFQAKRKGDTELIPEEYRIDDATAFGYLMATMGIKTTESYIRSLFNNDEKVLTALHNEEQQQLDLCSKLARHVLLGDRRPLLREVKRHIFSLLRIAMDEGTLFVVCEALRGYRNLEEHYRREISNIQRRLIRNWVLENKKEERILKETNIDEGYVPLNLRFLDDMYPAPWYRDNTVKRGRFPLDSGEKIRRILAVNDRNVMLKTAENHPNSCFVLLRNNRILSVHETYEILLELGRLSERSRISDTIEMELFCNKRTSSK